MKQKDRRLGKMVTDSQERRNMAQWIIDSDHSCEAFAIRHMMLANVRGQFNMKGTIDFDPRDTSRAAVEVADPADHDCGIMWGQ
jgi:polyisoprenoid-binding protein YceI